MSMACGTHVTKLKLRSIFILLVARRSTQREMFACDREFDF